MSEKDVVEKLLEKYPGLRLMHKISFEQKNWINKHILAAKFAVFNIRDQTLTNEEQSNIDELIKSHISKENATI